MKYPVNEQSFISKWLSALDDPDDGDRDQALATVQAINRAYRAGLEAGGDSDLLCMEDSGFKLSETILKYATDDEIAVFRSICKMTRERSISDDIK